MSVHHLVDLLTVHGVAHLAAPKTSGSTNSRDDSVHFIGDLWRRAVGHKQWCNDVTDLACYATMMMMMMMICLLRHLLLHIGLRWWFSVTRRISPTY